MVSLSKKLGDNVTDSIEGVARKCQSTSFRASNTRLFSGKVAP